METALGGDGMSRRTALIAAMVGFIGTSAAVQAQEARVSFEFNGAVISIDRANREAAQDAAGFITTDTGCGAACIAPLQVAPGVETFADPQVLAFLTDQVARNAGLMVDARTPQDRARGFIPGSVSLPHGTVDPQGQYWADVVAALGAQPRSQGGFDWSRARTLLVYDTGPGSNDAGRLVDHLMAVGYPASKIKYYRGGMQVWSVLGFNIERTAS